MHISPELTQNPLKIKQDDKFFSRVVSKENSAAYPSFRVYYGNVAGAVPFTLEIQPGTPKHKFSENSVPPLTPPPSYYISNPNHHQNMKRPKRKYYPGSKILYNLLLNINAIKKRHVAASTPSSLSSSSWASSMSSNVDSSKGYNTRRRRFSSFCSSVDDGHPGGSLASVMCFGGGGSYTVLVMKKAFLSIMGCRRSG